LDSSLKEIIWRQLGGALDMLENCVAACPEELWSDRTAQPEYWYMVYHTLFFLDLYLSGSLEGFRPPEPFNLDELDPAGIMPERVYTKDEMQSYLEHCREKCRATIRGLTPERARTRIEFPWFSMGFTESLLSNMRHVQHHTAQLNLIMRQRIDSAPRWVKEAKSKL
jgi:hypothetical protein